MINNISYFILFYIIIILTLSKLNINFIKDNYIIIDRLNDIISKNKINITDKYEYLSNKFDLLFILRIIINLYIGYNRDNNLFIYQYIIIYMKNIIIEIILILGNIESNIVINPIIMTISDIIGKLLNNSNKQKYIIDDNNSNIQYNYNYDNI